MLKFIKSIFKGKEKRQLNSRYDAAKTTRHNAAHWSAADDLSADAAMSPDVRRVIRNRARYEVANNSYARGLVLTLAEFGIGTGPRLMLLTKDRDYNSQVEQEFAVWSEAVNLGEKLKTLRQAKAVDGEAFAVIVSNPKVNHDVKLDLRLVEADRVASPYPNLLQVVDGINFDRYGNVLSYDILNEHPGGGTGWKGTCRTISADFVLHWYRQDRPEQSRGISELLPSLSLFGELRRYTEAVISAAETAADFAAVIHSTLPDAELSPMDITETVPIAKGLMAVLPDGRNITQLKAEQPTTTYQMFKREILTEIGRCLQMPANIIFGDSSEYNYASGRLDHQTFFKSIKGEQSHCEKVILFPILESWYRAAVRAGVIEDRSIRNIGSQFARFYWDGVEHVDPLKEANAAAAFINARVSNLSIECARKGLDWEDVLLQRARELQRMKELGIDDTPQKTDEKTGGEDKKEEEAK
ncbi:MAG: phage portal protein [Planctomycetaceae bacterium]|nr:phage portal protein [Planctomycetaceae bacterium]